MTFAEYESALGKTLARATARDALNFCKSTLARHFSAMAQDGHIPYAHASCDELTAAIADLSEIRDASSTQVESLAALCKLADDATAIDSGVPIHVLEFLISADAFLSYLNDQSIQHLREISYRGMSYVDSTQDVDDTAWFSNPAIRAEYDRQIADLTP